MRKPDIAIFIRPRIVFGWMRIDRMDVARSSEVTQRVDIGKTP
jgi:hypothetical protein